MDFREWYALRKEDIEQSQPGQGHTATAALRQAKLITSPSDLQTVNAIAQRRLLNQDLSEEEAKTLKALEQKSDLGTLGAAMIMDYPQALRARALDSRSHVFRIVGPAGGGKSYTTSMIAQILGKMQEITLNGLETGKKAEDLQKELAETARRLFKPFEAYAGGKIDWDKWAEDFIGATRDYGKSGSAAKMTSRAGLKGLGDAVAGVLTFNRKFATKNPAGGVEIVDTVNTLSPLTVFNDQMAKATAMGGQKGADPEMLRQLVQYFGDPGAPVAMGVITDNNQKSVFQQMDYLNKQEGTAARMGLGFEIHGETTRFVNMSRQTGTDLGETNHEAMLWDLLGGALFDNDKDADNKVRHLLTLDGIADERHQNQILQDKRRRILDAAKRVAEKLGLKPDDKTLVNIAKNLTRGAATSYFNVMREDGPDSVARRILLARQGFEKANQGSQLGFNFLREMNSARLRRLGFGTDEIKDISNTVHGALKSLTDMLGVDFTLHTDKDVNPAEAKELDFDLLGENDEFYKGLEELGAKDNVEKARKSIKEDLGDLTDRQKFNEALAKKEDEYAQNTAKELHDSGLYDKLKTAAEEYVNYFKGKGASENDIIDMVGKQVDWKSGDQFLGDELFSTMRRFENERVCKLAKSGADVEKFQHAPEMLQIAKQGDRGVFIDMSKFTNSSRQFRQWKEMHEAYKNYMGEDKANELMRYLVLQSHGPSLSAHLMLTALGLYSSGRGLRQSLPGIGRLAELARKIGGVKKEYNDEDMNHLKSVLVELGKSGELGKFATGDAIVSELTDQLPKLTEGGKLNKDIADTMDGFTLFNYMLGKLNEGKKLDDLFDSISKDVDVDTLGQIEAFAHSALSLDQQEEVFKPNPPTDKEIEDQKKYRKEHVCKDKEAASKAATKFLPDDAGTFTSSFAGAVASRKLGLIGG